MMFFLFASVALGSSVASQGVGASSRADVQTYLESVYGMSNFASFSDAALYQFFNTLTFYYQDRPTPPNWPKGRKQSHPCKCAVLAVFREQYLYFIMYYFVAARFLLFCVFSSNRPTHAHATHAFAHKHVRADAGTVCDCLHINLTMCETRPAKCEFWPLETYLNLPWVLKHQLPGFPSNAWFEGLTYPGEWGFPISCQNYTLGSEVSASAQLCVYSMLV